MSDRQSNVREADAKLAEIMLSAHATSAEGREAIQGLQKDIVAALNDPKNNLDTADGELQFLKFLREKAETAQKLVQDGKLTSEDQAKLALALADFYKAGSGGPDSEEPQPGEPAPGTPPGATPPPADPGLYPSDPGLLGPSPEMPDPMLGDLGLPPETSPLSDALGAAAPLLSGMGNPLGGGLPGGGLDLGAITKPIGDAISAAADQGSKDEPKPDEKPDESEGDKPEEKKPGEEGPDGQKPGDPNQPPPPGQPAPAPAPGSVPDPALAPPAPPAPSLNVDLKDGSQVTAADPSRAGATRSLLTGTQYGRSPAAERARRAAAGHDVDELSGTESASAGRLRDVSRQAGGCAGTGQVRRRGRQDRTVEHAAARRVPRFRPPDRGCRHGDAGGAATSPCGAAVTVGRATAGATTPTAGPEVGHTK